MNSGLPILDAIASAKARDAALEEVSSNNQDWMRLALLQIEQFARIHDGWANTEHGVTGEDIRRMVLPHVGHPGSPNAWGALIRRAITKGLIVATGEYRHMKEKRSHARRTSVYRFEAK